MTRELNSKVARVAARIERRDYAHLQSPWSGIFVAYPVRMTLRNSIFAGVVMVVLAPAGARAALSPNGLSPNGLSPNGLSPNGLSPNGLSPNGLVVGAASFAWKAAGIDPSRPLGESIQTVSAGK